MNKRFALLNNDFFLYFIIGGTATLLDWGIFWTANQFLHLYYQVALVLAYVIAGIFHFFANKWITFKCQSKQLRAQYSIYVLLTLTSLFLSMILMSLLVHIVLLNAMTARMVTTFGMLVPNYLLHKYITFSKKLFVG